MMKRIQQIIVLVLISIKVNGQVIDSLKSFDSNGNTIKIEFLKDGIKSNYIEYYEYDSENRITKEFVTDTLGEILPRIGLSEIIEYKYEKVGGNSIETIAYLDKESNPTTNDRYGFHKVKTTYDTRKQKIEEWFFSKNGSTFERIGFKYNDKGLLSEVNYLNEMGTLTEEGLAKVKLEYDDQGRCIKESNFDYKEESFHSTGNPHLTKINYLDGIECKRYYDDKMVEQKTTQLSICESISNFQLPNKDGVSIGINDQNGKIKIVHFWASWSSPCKYMNRKLVKLIERLDSNQVEVISIALEKEGDREKWQTKINESNLKWNKHLSDFKHWESKGAIEFGVKSIPRYFVIDENGFLIGNDLRSVWEIEEILIKKRKL